MCSCAAVETLCQRAHEGDGDALRHGVDEARKCILVYHNTQAQCFVTLSHVSTVDTKIPNLSRYTTSMYGKPKYQIYEQYKEHQHNHCMFVFLEPVCSLA